LSKLVEKTQNISPIRKSYGGWLCLFHYSPAPPVTEWCYDAAVGIFILSGSSSGILCTKI